MWKSRVLNAPGEAVAVTNRNLMFVGSGLLAFGLFMPIVTLPIVGTVSLFGNGGNVAAISLLALAVLATGLAAKERLGDALWPGAVAVGILIYCFGRLQHGIGQMRNSLRELEDNPFAGLAEGAVNAVQIQWGWLPLFGGAALIVYVAWKSRPDGRAGLFVFPDGIAKGAAVAAALALMSAPIFDLMNGVWSVPPSSTNAVDGTLEEEMLADNGQSGEPGVSVRPSREEAAYIAQHLEVYELEAKYFDSILDGRVPGVTFKVKNNGERTLNRVTVRVVFQDAAGQPIAEEEYSPVLVSSYSFGDANTPLRPNYISQQDRGSFYTAKSVPSEWQVGQATARITEIEFAPDE